MNITKQKTLFDQLILESIDKSKTHIKPETVYYDDDYYNQLVLELKERQLYKNYAKRELKETSKGSDKIKMCSVASSSRLCFLYFIKDNMVTMEVSLNTGTSGNAQLDAAKDTVFYECKCHEIFDNHDTDKNHLRLAYKKNLQKYFGIIYQEKDENYCKLSLSDFGIENKESIYSLHFDMKQLLCHLFGIARNGGGTLQYIFFTPKKELIENNEFCRNIYKELENEINQIWYCEKITTMINNFKIKLPHPQMIDVSSIEDVVLKNMEL